MKKVHKITISDVAREAGVSVTMVSFVLNGRTDRVSPETAERIRAAIKGLGYRPRAHRTRRENLVRTSGVAAVRGGPGQVALVIPDPAPEAVQTAFVEGFVPQLAQALGEYGLDLITLSVGATDRLPHCLASGQVQGVILRAGAIPDTLRAALADIPCVQFFGTTTLRDVPWDEVVTDDEKMGRLAADHFIRGKCRSLVVLNPDDGHPAYHLRMEAFLFGARLAGIPAESISVPRGESLRPAIRRLTKLQGRTGLYLCGTNHLNDPWMLGGWLHELLPKGAVGRQTLNIAPGPWLDAEGSRIARHCAEQMYWRMGHPEAETRRILIAPAIRPSTDKPLRNTDAVLSGAVE